MRYHLHHLLICLPLLVVMGCGGGRTGAGEAAPSRTSADLLLREQVRSYADAYQAVEALRSRWLNSRGPDSFSNPSQVLVYRDDVQLGGVGTLRTISTVDIGYIRYYDGTTASARWGFGHGAGVIYVSTALR
jgi:hypothetical protein